MPCLVSGKEIILSGDVGSSGDWWFGEEPGFTSSDVIMALAQVGDANDVTIRINSGGGIAWEGSAIHSAIARHKGKKTVLVEGIAASAASVIAMAGDEVVCALGAMIMVHDPSGITIGTARDHQDQINCLEALSSAMSTIYAAKTGQDADVCRADMSSELWMTADQAVAKGYADRVEGTPANDDEQAAPVEPAPFAYRGYRHAPAAFVALADAKRWPKQLPKAVTQIPPQAQEPVKMPTEDEIQARIDAAVKNDREKQKADQEAEAQRLQQEQQEQQQAQQATASTLNRADAAEIAEICVSGGAPSITAALIREGVSAAVATQRVNAAGQIKDVVALARKNAPHLAADFADKAIASGKSVEQVKASLFDSMAAADEAAPVDAHHRTGAGGADHNAGDGDARAKSKASMKAELQRRGMLPKKEG